jgi:hypothetical protein
MALDAAAGAAAGCISRVIVAPLDLVKIRLQVQLEPVLGGSGISKYTGFTHAIATVLREEGVTVRRASTCCPYTHTECARGGSGPNTCRTHADVGPRSGPSVQSGRASLCAPTARSNKPRRAVQARDCSVPRMH